MRGSATGPLAAGGTAARAIPVTGPRVLTVHGKLDLTTTYSLYVLARPPATGDQALLSQAAFLRLALRPVSSDNPRPAGLARSRQQRAMWLATRRLPAGRSSADEPPIGPDAEGCVL
jgi:hypothetical protein